MNKSKVGKKSKPDKTTKDDKSSKKVIARNKKAYHEYIVMEKYQAGIELKGTEVKSIRSGKVNLKDSYVKIDKKNQAFIIGMHISPYEKGNRFNHFPLRNKKLLLHKKELFKLAQATREKGLTIVSTLVYLIRGLVKIEIATAKGKQLHDKRATLKEKAIKRDLSGMQKNLLL